MIGRFLAGLLVFLVTAVVAYALAIIGYALVTGLLAIPDRDGGSAMAVALVFAPLCAVVAGLAGLRAFRSKRSD